MRYIVKLPPDGFYLSTTDFSGMVLGEKNATRFECKSQCRQVAKEQGYLPSEFTIVEVQ